MLDPASVSHMESVIADVRATTRGEIAVVTLPDIGDGAAAVIETQYDDRLRGGVALPPLANFAVRRP